MMKKTKETPELIHITEASRRVGISRNTIRAAVLRGDLVPVIAQPVVLLDAVTVEKWAETVSKKGGRPKKKREG